MTTQELQKILKNLPRYPGNKFYPPAPVIHKGFPSSFNLSFAENEILNEFNNQYLNFDHNLIYSKIQPCIRHQDWDTILKNKKDRWRYLGLFNMADISSFIILEDSKKQEDVNKFVIKSFVDFVRRTIGLDVNKLVISYFKETKIKDATVGKYNIDKFFPTDPMLDYWKKLGIKNEQLVSDQTRNTLLSLKVFGKPTPWGYRNEIHYEYKNELLDIGTVEYLPYHPVLNDKQEIIDIKDNPHTIAISAVGLERILVVINNLDYIWDVDNIKPLIDFILENSKNKDKIQAMIVAQALRVIYQIVADGGVFSSLNNAQRKKYARGYYRSLFENFDSLEIQQPEIFIQNFLKLNFSLNYQDKKDKKTIRQTMLEIQNRKRYSNGINLKNNKLRNVAQ